MVVVAQLVRALDCGSRGRRFETGLPPKKIPKPFNTKVSGIIKNPMGQIWDSFFATQQFVT